MCSVCGERVFGRESRDASPECDGADDQTVPQVRAPVLSANLGDKLVCLTCLQQQPQFERAAAYGSYDGGLRELIHLLKYEHVRPAANLLGRMLAEVVADLAETFEPDVPVVMAVPLHASKTHQRGFNQAELIARAMLKLKPAALDLKLNNTALIRSRVTESQTGLTPPQRRENIRGAFKVVRRDELSGRDILLIDDVFTTGATVSECARVLRRAGANRVFVATVARVLKPEVQRVGLSPAGESGDKIEDEPRVMAAHA